MCVCVCVCVYKIIVGLLILNSNYKLGFNSMQFPKKEEGNKKKHHERKKKLEKFPIKRNKKWHSQF